MARLFYGLTGTLLTDLLLAGRIGLTEERSPRIYIANSEPTGYPVLDRALEILPTKDGKRFSSLVRWGKLNLTRHIAESLAAAGVVRIRTGGLFDSLDPSYLTLDPLPERQLRAHIDAALRGVQPPTASGVALPPILQTPSVASTVLPQQETGLSRGELKCRIKELAGEGPAGRAAQRAMKAVTMATIAVGSVAAASSSWSPPTPRAPPPPLRPYRGHSTPRGVFRAAGDTAHRLGQHDEGRGGGHSARLGACPSGWGPSTPPGTGILSPNARDVPGWSGTFLAA